jgi:hypothetical protein
MHICRRETRLSLSDYRNAMSDAPIASCDAAREIYCTYGKLLCDAGRYSTLALLISVAKGLWRPRPRAPGDSALLAVYDTLGASGLRTLQEMGAGAPLDLRPSMVLAHLRPFDRARTLLALARHLFEPRRFFDRLFRLYAAVAVDVLGDSRYSGVMAANERSLGCAAFVAAAKFLCARAVTIVQHGNPICDFLPTLADVYLCRSNRWFEYLLAARLVPTVRRIKDFDQMPVFRHAGPSRRVVLVLHNIGYLEPDLDYRELARQIEETCRQTGHTLMVLKHPACDEDFGLAAVDRTEPVAAALVVGFRSTVLDQLPADMPRISLLDYWPSFFMQQGTTQQKEHFLSRIADAMA